MDSNEDYNNDSDYDNEYLQADIDNGDDDYLEAAIDLSSQPRPNYTVLTEADVKQHQEEDITKLSNLLSISTVDACTILRRYNWKTSKIHDDWFADGGVNVRKTVGLLGDKVAVISSTPSKIKCGICFTTYRRGVKKMSSAPCGHHYCKECWKMYIGTAVGDGPGCLLLHCPEPSCNVAVGEDMIDLLAGGEVKENYARHLLRSYIEVSTKMKWCPSPDCGFVVSLENESDNFDVQCLCEYVFCWNCSEEAHSPIDCKTIAKWTLKNSSEAENTVWIMAYCKPCPKCGRQIDKNEGCNHMTCRDPCRHEFCWLCLGPWKNHGSCNRYNDEGELKNKKREEAKTLIERYAHYYERWANNHKSRQKSLAELHTMRTEKIDILQEKVNLTSSEMTFLIEAWEQISECRRLLKWTYAYGYYLPEEEFAKKQLFEYLQGEAESMLEQLHKGAEIDVKKFFDEEAPTGIWHEFVDYRRNLAELTQVTRNYFENLVRALQNGLQEVDSSQVVHNKTTCKRSKDSTQGPPSDIEEDIRNQLFWVCTRCTFNNSRDATHCEECQQVDIRSQWTETDG